MSIVFSTENAVVLDHEAWIMETYKKYLSSDTKDPNSGGMRNFQHLFSLRTPFMMDGQAEKVAKQMECSLDCIQPPRKKKQKRCNNMQNPAVCAESSHVTAVFTALRDTLEFKKHFCVVPSANDFRKNNRLIRDIRKSFTEMSGDGLPMPSKDCTECKHKVVTYGDSKYILPPNVTYICDDVTNILSHTGGKKFDLVVMDPPWKNKYVRRRNSAHGTNHGYDMMSVSDILKLPIQEILADEALLVIWCTNNENQVRELKEGLYQWDVDLVATWYWLKVTLCGEPVTPFTDGAHGKRPYEQILLARRRKEPQNYTKIQDGLVLCSIPSGIHSHKPPLSDILLPYIPTPSSCLEIFARSLIPGWTSYGLEVLKLQNSYLYKVN